MNKYFLHGKLNAKENEAEHLGSISLEAANVLSNAKGCLFYVIGKDPADASAIWVTEIWETKEDHDQSLTDPAVRSLIMQAMPLLDGMPQKGQELFLLGGKGVLK